MILVNNPGSWSYVYWPLDHAKWNGWTPTDLIFPFFLFIVGVSITLSFASRLDRGFSRESLAAHIVTRSTVLFALGIFLNGFPDFSLGHIRIMGVLQRIALCYLAAGLICLIGRRPNETDETDEFHARGIPSLIAAVTVALLVGYWALMRFVPVPGYGAGHLDPEGNLSGYIDRSVFGVAHLWSESATWDPEGLLSTLPAIATTLIGVLAGSWLRSNRSTARRALGLMIGGVAGIAVGRLLNPFFPINKNLWTSTFAVFSAGFAMLLFGICYWLIDVRGYRRWTVPLQVYGRNAIAVFALSSLLATASIFFTLHDATGAQVTWHDYVYGRFFAHLASPPNASLLFAICYCLLWLAIMWPLYRRRIFIRI
jgi:predicted acyltransferase